jgi:hypothetical protein
MAARFPNRAVLASIAVVLGAAGRAPAQVTGPGASAGIQGQQSIASSMYQAATVGPGTGFLSPYLMTMGQTNPDYITYMYLQNQRNGGIGSGVLSGTRVAPGVPAGSTVPARPKASAMDASTPLGGRGAYPSRPPAELNRVTLPMIANTPGGNTGAYYMRGPRTNNDAASFFNRTTPARNNRR